jgi:hypothetical protein
VTLALKTVALTRQQVAEVLRASQAIRAGRAHSPQIVLRWVDDPTANCGDTKKFRPRRVGSDCPRVLLLGAPVIADLDAPSHPVFRVHRLLGCSIAGQYGWATAGMQDLKTTLSRGFQNRNCL